MIRQILRPLTKHPLIFKLLFAAVVVTGFVIILPSTQHTNTVHANAPGCPFPPNPPGFTGYNGYGYFMDQQSCWGDAVLPEPGTDSWAGPPQNCDPFSNVNAVPATTTPDLINEIETYYSENCGQSQSGAAFLIETMLGNPSPNPPLATNVAPTVSASDESTWASRITAYGNAGLIHFDESYTFNYNTYWQGDASVVDKENGGAGTSINYDDDASYSNESAYGTGTYAAIVFYSQTTGQPIYAIKINCGNAVFANGYSGLPPITQTTPPPSSPQVNIIANNLPAGTTLSFTSPNETIGSCESTVNQYFYLTTPSTLTCSGTQFGNSSAPATLSYVGGAPMYYAVTGWTESGSVSGLGGYATCNVNGCSFDFNSGTATVTLTFSYSPPIIPCPTGYTGIEPNCTPIANSPNEPYLRVTNGDTVVGGGFCEPENTSPGSAGSLPAGGIYSWNPTSPYNINNGAGGQFAVMALGPINGFASSQNGSSGGTSLSFANTSNTSPPNFGGNLGSGPCGATDFYNNGVGNATTGLNYPTDVTNGNLTSDLDKSGTYKIGTDGSPAYIDLASSSQLTLGTSPAQQTILYVDGDVYIGNNICYGTGTTCSTYSSINPSSLANVPLFELIVKGNIAVAPNVTRLDGIYVAEPNSSSQYTKDHSSLSYNNKQSNLASAELIPTKVKSPAHAELAQAAPAPPTLSLGSKTTTSITVNWTSTISLGPALPNYYALSVSGVSGVLCYGGGATLGAKPQCTGNLTDTYQAQCGTNNTYTFTVRAEEDGGLLFSTSSSLTVPDSCTAPTTCSLSLSSSSVAPSSTGLTATITFSAGTSGNTWKITNSSTSPSTQLGSGIETSTTAYTTSAFTAPSTAGLYTITGGDNSISCPNTTLTVTPSGGGGGGNGSGAGGGASTWGALGGKASTGGYIYTCWDPSLPTQSYDSSGCYSNGTLMVNGAFAADTLKFWRTWGTVSGVGTGTNAPAEIFNYSSLVWLAEPSTSVSNGKVNAVLSLPPVL
jgi:hypothetical protein